MNYKAPSITKLVLSVVMLVVSITILSVVSDNIRVADAVSGSDFQPGRIIDDTVFYNHNAMNTSQIQSFLNSQVPNCGSSYTCLKDFSMNVPSYAGGSSNACPGSMSGGNKSAARIVNDVAKSCKINPQVILATLQKEVTLITCDGNSCPGEWRYRTAMGYGCPDSTPSVCNSQYYGFYNQVFLAARQFQFYRLNPSSYNHIPHTTNNVRYHPNSSCGTRSVYIENQATAGLYNYTPYTPNQAALNNYPGTGNSCSSYGNRNFWFTFNNWFGSTLGPNYGDMQAPRYMRIRNDLRKVDPISGQEVGRIIEKGEDIYFTSFAWRHGEQYIRSRYDTDNNWNRSIPRSELTEIEYRSMQTPRYMRVKHDLRKVDPVFTTEEIGKLLEQGEVVNFTDKLSVNGIVYLRSQFDSGKGWNRAIPIDDLEEIDPEYTLMQTPRYMRVRRDLRKVDPVTGSEIGKLLKEGETIYFSDTFSIGGIQYLRSYFDSNQEWNRAIPIGSLDDVE